MRVWSFFSLDAKRRTLWVVTVLLWLIVAFPLPIRAPVQQWHLHVGDMRVLQFDEVARVAVGDGPVLNAVAAEKRVVLVFANDEGHSSWYIWTEDGERYECG